MHSHSGVHFLLIFGIAFYPFLSAFFLETISLPPRYHLNTTSLPLNYYPVLTLYLPHALLPVKCSAISRRVNKYSSIVSTCSRVFYFFLCPLAPNRIRVSLFCLFSPWRMPSISSTFPLHFYFALQCKLHSLEQKQSFSLILFIFIGLTEPVFLFKYLSQSLFPLKICTSANFSVPLQAERIKPPTIRTEASVQRHIKYSVISQT